jgi:Phosphotransferase enzyme family
MLPKELVENAAKQFLGPDPVVFSPLGNGLIHQSFLVSGRGGSIKIVLQSINTTIFKNPEDILYNYNCLFEYIQKQEPEFIMPAPVKTIQGKLGWTDEEKHFWRATTFIRDSYSPMTADHEQSAKTVAKSFALFTRSLAGLDVQLLRVIIPDFHNLSLRYRLFEDSIERAPIDRLLKSTHLIAELRQRKHLAGFYEKISSDPDYPDRVMHHDCKISNILFQEGTNEVICPVDLDTVMPGKFFSDLGDMIRSMAAAVDENSTHWEAIEIRSSFYQAILEGYLQYMGPILTENEKKNIHQAGLIMIYMQSLRFLTDFLNMDIYYQTSYPEQNLNRALNQLILLERLEIFLSESNLRTSG